MSARTAFILISFLAFLVGNARASQPGEDFFTNSIVHQFEVELTAESLASLRREPRVYVPASVRANGQLYTNVGVHLKGVATFRPVDDQPSLTLNFAKFDRRQRFRGLRKIHLNNGKEDPTFLCEALSAEMYQHARMPVARVALGQTRLNGRDLGPYVIKEGFTEEFLERHFRNTAGNLYDSGFRNDVNVQLEKLLGKKPHDWADLKRLTAAARTSDPARRWQLLSASLETNAFASYLAMQVLTCNWDGYALYQNNYRIYQDPDCDRLFFFPHGMDQMFSRPTFPLMPPRWNGIVARAFMETAPGRELYIQKLTTLATNVYHADRLARRVDELGAQVRPMVAARDEAAAIEYDRVVRELRARIVLRGKFLDQQLSNTNWTVARVRR